MFSEKIRFNEKNFESKPQSLQEILENLRKLQNDYFESTSDEEKAKIEEAQRNLIKQLEDQAAKILKDIENPATSETDRDKLMGQYGFIMDQIAIRIPWSEKILGKEREIQGEALEKLRQYLEKRPRAKEVIKAIFMLFHHGAGIDKSLTAEANQRMLQHQPPTKEFALRYVEAENKAKKFLERYIALSINRESFSLDEEYQELLKTEPISDEQFSYLLDVANWYRRIAYYQKIAGLTEEQKKNAQRAIDLYKKLIEKEPNLSQALEAVYKEQGIEKEDY